MTDPKSATPATDEEIALRHTRGKSENQYWNFQQMLVARIAADAETIKAARQERDAVKEALVEARETIHKQAEEIERLKGVHRAWINEDQASAELATAREQVRTLREALVNIINFHGDEREWVALAKRTLAATEPKG